MCEGLSEICDHAENVMVNMNAAEICGHKPFIRTQMGSVVDVVVCDESGNERAFDITNPKDALDVVIALGEKHGLGIMYDGNEYYVVDIYGNPVEVTTLSRNKHAVAYYAEHIDALSAAITAVGNK